MTDYQKMIIKRQEQFLEKESERYFAQKRRLESWPRIKRIILGKIYRDLIRDMEDLHTFNQRMITNLAKQLMNGTFDSPVEDYDYLDSWGLRYAKN